MKKRRTGRSFFFLSLYAVFGLLSKHSYQHWAVLSSTPRPGVVVVVGVWGCGGGVEWRGCAGLTQSPLMEPEVHTATKFKDQHLGFSDLGETLSSWCSAANGYCFSV